MKKFYNKFSKPQWRVSIASVTAPSFLRRSANHQKENMSENMSYLDVPKKKNRNSSGSYDLQQAQIEFDKNNAVVETVVVEPRTSDTESEENYEDARGHSDKLSSGDDLESSFYADAISASPKKIETRDNNSPLDDEFHYDVPKISFSFFGEKEKLTGEDDSPEYEIVTVKTAIYKPSFHNSLSENSEVLVEYNESPLYVNNTEDEKENQLEEKSISRDDLKTDVYAQVKLRNKHKSEIQITLNEELKSNVNSKSEINLNNALSTEVENKFVDLYLTKSLEDFNLFTSIKSGSDPTISHSLKDIPEEEEDNIYKVPVNNKRFHRLSKSLTEFDAEDMINGQLNNSNSEDIEHISCSQIIIENVKDDSRENSQNLEYCKERNKIPLKLRRPTLLRKPRNKAIGTWSHFRTKVSNMMAEHAAKQKMANITSRESEGQRINLEEVYKNSRDKCKKMIKSTGKMFNNKIKKDSRERGDGAKFTESSSQIIKNDAFFAKVRLRPSDIEYKLNNDFDNNCGYSEQIVTAINMNSLENIGIEDRNGLDITTLKVPFKKSKSINENQSGFEDLRKYVKQGSDFCKELSTILQERSEAELQYSKSLAKLSAKLSRACRDNVGAINEAWRAVAYELEARAEAHRILSGALAEDAARPLRNLNETQHKTRKQAEGVVDKAARTLTDWRVAEAKGKKHSHACARENEKLQDQLLDVRLSRTSSLIQLAHMHNQKSVSEKETAKLEGKKRKAEDAVKKADIEYYTLCVRAERARLEWESSVLKGSNVFQSLEDERLNNLKTILTAYLHHSAELGPRLIEATEKLKNPVNQTDPSKDLTLFINLRNSSQQLSEQLLPDFYCEHITLAMNRDRRKQSLVKLLHLIRQDLERERKSKNGLENLSKAIKQTPNFGAEDSQQNVCEKLYHMKSMLTYLEAARYKVQSALLELDNRPRAGHPLAPHINITRDKSGLQHSVLKVPQWLRDEWGEPEKSPISEKSEKSEFYSDGELLETDPDWTDRGAADGNSNQPDSDFDEFSSQTSSTDGNCEDGAALHPIATCRALYAYTPNLPDELTLHPGDMLSVYRKQDDGWWLGECNGNVGIFPATYVENVIETT